MLAASVGCLEGCKMLMKTGLFSINDKDANGKVALNHALT